MLYYITVNESEKTFNAFDEFNLEFIPEGNRVVATIDGDDNVEQVMRLMFIMRPDLVQVQPFV